MTNEPTIVESSMDAEQSRRQRVADIIVEHHRIKRAQAAAQARRERWNALANDASNIWRKLTARLRK